MKVLVVPACRMLRAWSLVAVIALPGATQAAPASHPVSAAASSAPASGAVISAPTVPDPASFKAMDKPSDDGSAMRVEWARPAREAEGIAYVVEIAESPNDFKSGKFKSKVVKPSPPDEGDLYRTDISPASDKFFPPPESPPLTAERLKELAAEKVITGGELARAQAIMESMQRAQSKPGDQSRPAAESKPGTQSSPGSASEPSAELPREDKDWFGRLREYVHNRDWLKSFATAENRALTDGQLSRALAALESEYRERNTAGDRAEQDWLHRLMAFLKEKDQSEQKDRIAAINSRTWYVRLAVMKGDKKFYVGEGGQPAIRSARAKANYFNWAKLNNLLFSLIFCAIVFAFIEVAKRRRNLFLRKIAGLEAVDEAIGRSTEMDRPVFFVHGLGGMGDLATIASVNILARVARRTAEHDSRVRVMNVDPIVTAVSQEVVQQAYTEAGRPDAYNPDDVSLVASDQFSYVAAVSGIMVREQPGAIFLLGSFYAESLLLAETGASTGAIQIAGTDAYTQLPFFITTCDYTLIGEELYAASAYLSREPRLLGSLRGQDVGKAFLMIVMIVGSLVLTVAAVFGANLDWLRRIFSAN